jgi:tellurium resistance protein TerZ
MSIGPQEEQPIDLEQETGHSPSHIFMGLGWCKKKVESHGFLGFGSGTQEVDVDLDASCLLFNKSGRLVDQVWFEQLQSQCGSVIHSGDDETGSGNADAENERITVDLQGLPAVVETLVFTVTSFSGESFVEIPHAFCVVVDVVADIEIVNFDLSVEGGDYTGLILAKLYHDAGEWKLQTLGKPAQGRTCQELLPVIKDYL